VWTESIQVHQRARNDDGSSSNINIISSSNDNNTQSENQAKDHISGT